MGTTRQLLPASLAPEHMLRCMSNTAPSSRACMRGVLSLICAVVVEGATVTSFVTEASTMLVIGLVLSIFGIGLFCWLIFTLAVYALRRPPSIAESRHSLSASFTSS